MVSGALARVRPAFGTRLQLHDVVAGISVALVLIPQSLAYAELAGLPPHYGLYAAVLPPIAAAFFASSPYLQTGPVAITALLTFGALAAHAAPGTNEYVEMAALLALVVGAARLAVGLLRAGVIAFLLSHAVLLGFTSAAALLIIASQLPTAAGAAAPEGGVLERAVWVVGHPGAWDVEALVLAAGVLAVTLASRRVHTLFPGVLVAVAAGIVYAKATGSDLAGVGEIPTSLPPFSADLPWGSTFELLVPGLIIAFVGFAEPAAIARTFAALDRSRWNPDREFVSQGAANVAAAFSGGFPVGGSFSRSAVNRAAGARTRWSGAVTGLVVLAFLPFAWVLDDLPRVVLAAIVIGAVVKLVRPRELIGIVRLSRPQTAIAWGTFGLTLALAPHVERGVIAGVALAIVVHLWKELYFDIEAWTDGDVLHLKPKGVLWFGTAGRLEDAFLNLVAAHPSARRLELHLNELGRIDLTGALALSGVLDDARASGLDVAVREIPPHALPLIRRVIPPASGAE